MLIAPLPLIGALQEENEPTEEKKISGNLEVPPDLDEEVRQLFDEAKKTFDEFRKARREGKHRIKDMEKAISQFHRVRRKKKDFHLPYYYLGWAYQITREFDKAERQLKKALELREGFNEAMAELGDTYYWKRDWKKAIELFDRAIETDPEYVYAYQRRAWAHTRERKFDKALEDVKKWAKLEPSHEAATDQYTRMLEKESEEGAFDGFSKTETEHYTLITNESQAVADEMAEQAELIFRLYTSRFPKLDKGADKFPIIYFKNRDDYYAYGAPPNTGGYYSPFVRKLVLFNSGRKEQNYTVLYHEGFHQFVHYYIEGAPDWFGEGHGDFFGACRERPEKDRKGRTGFDILPNRGRLEYIQRCIRNGYIVPLPELMTMTRPQFYDRRSKSRNYAQAWSVVYFIWNYPQKGKGKYFPILAKYFKELRGGKSLKEAYERTFGKLDMEKIEEEWMGFTNGLRRG